jgi:hypothetical protein
VPTELAGRRPHIELQGGADDAMSVCRDVAVVLVVVLSLGTAKCVGVGRRVNEPVEEMSMQRAASLGLDHAEIGLNCQRGLRTSCSSFAWGTRLSKSVHIVYE